MRENKQIVKEIIKDDNILTIIVSLLKDIAEGIKETNDIRKQEQTELWKEVKDLKITSDRMYDNIYRESDVRPGILQTQKNLYDVLTKIQHVIYTAVSVIAFIQTIPMIREFIILLIKK